jgi:hypothetical protein
MEGHWQWKLASQADVSAQSTQKGGASCQALGRAHTEPGCDWNATGMD